MQPDFPTPTTLLPRKTIYLAGPMRGHPRWNFDAFDAAEAVLAADWRVLSPAAMDRAVGFDPECKVLPEGFLEGALDRDVKAILHEADAVAMLPGWERSTGAQAEYWLARWKGIPAYEYTVGHAQGVLREIRLPSADEDILEEALRLTTGARQAAYGPPDQDFTRTAQLWSALKGVPFEARDVALFMICLKLSRETHQRKRDNWVDIAGYARCGHLCQ